MRIGLTGGIGSGKSTVATMLAARGAVLVDTDAIARSRIPGRSRLPSTATTEGPKACAIAGMAAPPG
ncbi:MAG: dephospho-CoA kinase, partial [Variovorax sp.]